MAVGEHSFILISLIQLGSTEVNLLWYSSYKELLSLKPGKLVSLSATLLYDIKNKNKFCATWTLDQLGMQTGLVLVRGTRPPAEWKCSRVPYALYLLTNWQNKS